MSPQMALDGDEAESESLFDDAELVLYTAERDHAEYEPSTEWGQELDLVSFSLWARFEEEGQEIPIWAQAEEGCWFSLSADVYGPDEAEPVSDAFVDAVADLVEDGDTEWGTTASDLYEDLSGPEQLIWQRLQMALYRQDPPEALAVVQWCDDRAAQDGETA